MFPQTFLLPPSLNSQNIVSQLNKPVLTNHLICFDFHWQFFLHGVSTSFLTSSANELPEHIIPNKLTPPNINRLKCFDFLSQFLLHSVSTSFLTSSVIEFPEHSIPTKLTRPNINSLTFFDFLSEFLLQCFDKLSYFLHH